MLSTKAITDKGTYILKELDDSILNGTYPGNRLRLFHVRQTLQPDPDPRPKSRQGSPTNGERDESREPTEEDLQAWIPKDWPMAVVIPLTQL